MAKAGAVIGSHLHKESKEDCLSPKIRVQSLKTKLLVGEGCDLTGKSLVPQKAGCILGLKPAASGLQDPFLYPQHQAQGVSRASPSLHSSGAEQLCPDVSKITGSHILLNPTRIG